MLAEDRDWQFVACLGWSRNRWFGYISGYRQAAALIASRVADTGRHQDVLIYPFLMCWRHYAELQLKALILLLGKYHRGPVELRKTHKIGDLWKLARPLLEQAFPDDDQDAVLHSERVLMQLNALDPTSEHFRYPVLNDGSGTLANVGRIHIRRFHEAMEGVAHLFDACETGLSVMIDARAEYEANMAMYFGVETTW